MGDSQYHQEADEDDVEGKKPPSGVESGQMIPGSLLPSTRG
jgi:hypothetical protein